MSRIYMSPGLPGHPPCVSFQALQILKAGLEKNQALPASLSMHPADKVLIENWFVCSLCLITSRPHCQQLTRTGAQHPAGRPGWVSACGQRDFGTFLLPHPQPPRRGLASPPPQQALVCAGSLASLFSPGPAGDRIQLTACFLPRLGSAPPTSCFHGCWLKYAQ